MYFCLLPLSRDFSHSQYFTLALHQGVQLHSRTRLCSSEFFVRAVWGFSVSEDVCCSFQNGMARWDVVKAKQKFRSKNLKGFGWILQTESNLQRLCSILSSQQQDPGWSSPWAVFALAGLTPDLGEQNPPGTALGQEPSGSHGPGSCRVPHKALWALKSQQQEKNKNKTHFPVIFQPPQWQPRIEPLWAEHLCEKFTWDIK